eukprot:6203993-Pleurochrysis_carterae.AAC.2
MPYSEFLLRLLVWRYEFRIQNRQKFAVFATSSCEGAHSRLVARQRGTTRTVYGFVVVYS